MSTRRNQARASDVGFCGELYYAVTPAHRRAGMDVKFRPEAQGGGRSFRALRVTEPPADMEPGFPYWELTRERWLERMEEEIDS